ncbi:methylenetetrahydrofolate reductase [Candidatus Vidania fulgoroideorum]
MKFSCELFPGKFNKISKFLFLRYFNIKFISITFNLKHNYKRTIETSLFLSSFGIKIIPHIPCLNISKNILIKILKIFLNNNIKKILIVRGDIGKIIDFKSSYDIIRYIRKKKYKINIFIPYYPQPYFFFKNKNFDIYNIYKKSRFSISGLISQINFSFKNLDILKKFGEAYIGLLLSNNLNKIIKVSKFCNITIPYNFIYKINKNFLNYIFFLKKNIKMYKNIHIYCFNNLKLTFSFFKDI